MWWLALALAFQQLAALQVIDRGDQSGVDDARQVVVRTAEEWTALWRVHGMDRPQPKVDFSRFTVVGVFMGSRPTAGFKVDVVRVDVEGNTRVVRYRETAPRGDMMTAQVLTSPYFIAAIDKAGGDIRFEKIE